MGSGLGKDSLFSAGEADGSVVVGADSTAVGTVSDMLGEGSAEGWDRVPQEARRKRDSDSSRERFRFMENTT